ncbi:hypothetical protein [Brachyspira hampsonii]|nr:hypothetical protein [Brachyspira hampsonii]
MYFKCLIKSNLPIIPIPVNKRSILTAISDVTLGALDSNFN